MHTPGPGELFTCVIYRQVFWLWHPTQLLLFSGTSPNDFQATATPTQQRPCTGFSPVSLFTCTDVQTPVYQFGFLCLGYHCWARKSSTSRVNISNFYRQNFIIYVSLTRCSIVCHLFSRYLSIFCYNFIHILPKPVRHLSAIFRTVSEQFLSSSDPFWACFRRCRVLTKGFAACHPQFPLSDRHSVPRKDHA